MALFEYDQGRFFPAQFGRPVSSGISAEVLHSLREQVLDLLQRPFFPVKWLGDSNPSRLIALDASGQVVSIQVIETLDSARMVSSLAALNEVRGLGWNELSALYPGGQAAFSSSLAQFRSQVPANSSPGPRLIVVTTQVDEEVRPALEVLASSGMEVNEVSLREMSNGRQFIEITPVSQSYWGYSPLWLGGRSDSVSELPAGQEVSEAPALQAAPEAPQAPQEAESVPASEESEPKVFEAEDTPLIHTETHTPVSAQAPQATTEPVADTQALPLSRVSDELALAQGRRTFPSRRRRTREPQAEEKVAPTLNRDETALSLIARSVGEPLELVALVSGQVETVQLQLDGSLHGEAGAVSYTPAMALEALGEEPEDDAWGTWHILDLEGPSLADALDEINQELAHETLAPVEPKPETSPHGMLIPSRRRH
ncbi:hypothetical protein BSR29_05755 [Boudabousia liubingyangii]|uniref:RAMA domain-containing protein n=1 Tax=Boudabousia liubingyangii TaxID=1921764 RepID=A0A1Q5PLQ5_9ACTO|nr:hypothetical protein [Boudabousia liubingyangii]OKL47983.1 hypothetical protein BSR29_05755 [Boudabousia liubingyangii]